MNSLSYIAKTHCRNAFNMISVLLLALMSAIAFVGIGGYAGLVCASFFGLMTLITLLHTRGSALGCTLMQIPSVIISFAAFFSGIAVSALGFAIIHYSGVYDYVDGVLHQNGYALAVPPQTAGILLCVSSLAFFMASFFTFCLAKYLNTVKRCLKNVISCHGAGIFMAASIIMFIIAVAAAFVFVFSHGGLSKVMENSVVFSVLAEIVILAVLLITAGISASSFIKATSSFKELEDKTMKVETNADGTMYVPIKVYSDSDSKSAMISTSNNGDQDSKKAHECKKKFIISVDALEDSDAIDGSHSEHDII